MPPLTNQPYYGNPAGFPDGWVEASVANASPLWVPGGSITKAQMTPREIRRRRQMMDQLSQSFGKYFTNRTSTTGNPGRGLPKPPSPANFSILRAMAKASQIDMLIIGAYKSAARRFGQVCDVPGHQKGFRVVHRRYLDPDFNASTPDIQRRCAEMEELLKHPSNPPHQTFMDWLMVSINEQLVIDRRCLVLPKDKGGKIASYHLIPGDTIQPVLEVLAPWMRENNVADPEVAKYKMQIDLWKNPPRDPVSGVQLAVDLADAAYVQVLDGRVVSAWKAEDLYVGIANPSIEMDQAFYGTSPLEASIYMSLLFGRALRFNANMLDVNFPEAVLAITGDYDEAGVEAFKRAVLDFDEEEASSRLPVIAGDVDFQAQLINLRESPQDMKLVEMMRMLANFKCAAYRAHPSIINVPDEAGPVINNESDAEIEQALGEGFHGLMIDQANLLTNAIVSKRYDDLIVIVEGLDDESEAQKLNRIQIESSFRTIDELRVSYGDKALPGDLPTKIGDFIPNGAYLQIYQLLQQQQQQSMGQYEQGDFGQAPDDQGQPWQGGQQADQGQGQGQPGTVANDSNDVEAQGQQDAQDGAREVGNQQALPQDEQRKSEDDIIIRVHGSTQTLRRLLKGEDDIAEVL